MSLKNWAIGIAIALGAIILLKIVINLYWNKKQDIRMENHEIYLQSLKERNTTAEEEKPPNILIIFTDDMGFADISCFGSEAIETPNIDKIQKSGVTLTNFYSSAPICSPSRAGMLTGRYPVRTHVPTVFCPKNSLAEKGNLLVNMYSYGMKGISPDEVTMGEALQEVGYETGLLGKWHLGEESPHLPNDKGFDFFYGAFYSNDMNPYEIYRNREKELSAPVDQSKLTQNFTREALKFIEINKDAPFFLHYCQPFPHEPVHASDRFRGESHGGEYGDCVQEVDWSVGQILDKLEELDLMENTLIIFTSDNGPWQQGNPGCNRGRKGLVFEGGQKVPFLISFPKMFPQGVEIEEMAMNIDIFPTIMDMLGIPLPEDRIIDGRSLLPLLTQETKESPHEYLFYFWNKKIQAVRDNRWKYHIRKWMDTHPYWMYKAGPLLYDFKYDYNESYNQTMDYKERAQSMGKKIEEMKKSLKKNLRGWKQQ